MKNIYKISRRNALKSAALVAAPLVLPGRLFGASSPSKQVAIGCIGIGWQGGSNMDTFLGNSDCRVVAVADVDKNHLTSAKKKVDNKYGTKDCKAYADFRELIARPDVDAVAIGTPDNWHSIPAIMAAEAKKDVFCEKPLSHTLDEGMAMVAAVQKNERIWQTGSWQRSVINFRWAAGLVCNGYIGKVKRVEVGLPSGHSDFEHTGDKKPNCDPPETVDYDFWIGPATMMPFNPCRFHKNWRWNYNTGGGQLMDWIGHHCDIAHWGLSNAEFGCGPDDAVGPSEVSATADFPSPDAIWNTATKYRVTCKYPNNIEFIIAGGYKEIAGGTKWIGEGGWVHVDRGHFEASNPQWKAILDKGKRSVEEFESKGKFPLMVSYNHNAQFIDCIKSRKKTITPIEVANRSQTPGHLGYVASVLKRSLKWDAVEQKVVGDDEASKLLGRKFREPWHV